MCARSAALGCLFLFAACGAETLESSTSIEPAPNSSVPVTLNVRDLDGNPLANMYAIATTYANTIDTPVAQGTATDENGLATVILPVNRQLYLRAWDPELRYFANTFFEIQTLPGLKTQPMNIVMAKNAALRATVQDAAGLPFAGMRIGLILTDAKRGPWWPAKATADANGRVEFPNVPPGRFEVKLRTQTGAEAIVQNVMLAPGVTKDIGAVIATQRATP